METRNLSITIAVPLARAYERAHPPAFFAAWAAGLASSLHHTDHGWVAQTPLGEARVEFSPKNDYGVLDHRVRLPNKPEIYIPLRMVANGDATEVVLTLFREPHMSDADFAKDQGLVEQDLASLKRVLETP